MMVKIIMLGVNVLCIIGMGATLTWAGLALGNHGVFQHRMLFVWGFQAACLIFFGVRRFARKS